MPEAGLKSESFTPDNLVVGDDVITKNVTVFKGQVLTRGTVLGKITATGKYIKSAVGAGDGSETPDCILVADVDATDDDIDVGGYFGGEFNENAITLGTGHTVASIWEGLRAKGIFLKPAVTA